MVTRRHLVIGLPESGKTTFIAALWHVVQANEVASALRLERMDGDRTYLNELRDAWLQCNPVPRTNPRGERLVKMLLVDEAKLIHELCLPDISGETFREQWAQRQWALSYDDLVGGADGALLFVRPASVVEPLSLTTANQMVNDLGGPAGGEGAPQIPTVWNPIESPTQAQLVDLTQLLMWRRPDVRWRIGVVVSAWDEVRGLGQTPEEWCRRRLPLLDQFLRANGARLRVRYYGVSAQGGCLPTDAARLRAFTHASERIEVVPGVGSATRDITLPIRDLALGDD
jgi:hypothetical protein